MVAQSSKKKKQEQQRRRKRASEKQRKQPAKNQTNKQQKPTNLPTTTKKPTQKNKNKNKKRKTVDGKHQSARNGWADTPAVHPRTEGWVQPTTRNHQAAAVVVVVGTGEQKPKQAVLCDVCVDLIKHPTQRNGNKQTKQEQQATRKEKQEQETRRTRTEQEERKAEGERDKKTTFLAPTTCPANNPNRTRKIGQMPIRDDAKTAESGQFAHRHTTIRAVSNVSSSQKGNRQEETGTYIEAVIKINNQKKPRLENSSG